MSRFSVLRIVSVLVMGPAVLTLGCQSRQAKTEAPVERAVAAAADIHPGWEAKAPIEISKRAFDASNEVFQSHPDYLALNTPYSGMNAIFRELERRENLTLKNRGEAHVTVVTPPEATTLASQNVSMRGVEIVADRMQMGDSDLDPICLGMGQAMINGKMQRTYFIVLHSENLLRIRGELAHEAQPATDGKGFEAEPFYPHITVGFTLQDLFEQNGVIKDHSSCLYPLKLTP